MIRIREIVFSFFLTKPVSEHLKVQIITKWKLAKVNKTQQ